MIHVDIKKLGRFERPGLPAHRRHAGYRATYKAGWDVVRVAVDDTSGLGGRSPAYHVARTAVR